MGKNVSKSAFGSSRRPGGGVFVRAAGVTGMDGNQNPNQNPSAPFAQMPAPPKKRRRWLRRLVLISLVVLLLALPAGCAVYLTMSPTNSLELPWSIGFRTGVEMGPGAESSWDGGPQELYDTPEESWRESGRFQGGEFLSEPLAVEEDEDSVAILYFYDLGPEEGDKMEFNVVRMEKRDGRYAAPSKFGTYAFVDTDMASDGKYLYETVEAKTAFYIFDRLTDNLPEPAQGFQYFGVSTDPDIGELSVLGEHPTGVVDYSYEGETYYFWYYDGLDIARYLASRDDFSFDGFTAAQLIDVLRIEGPR